MPCDFWSSTADDPAIRRGKNFVGRLLTTDEFVVS
jgi:hypothetical protein